MTDYEKRHRAAIRQWFKQNDINGLQGGEPTEADYQRLWRRVHTPESETPTKPLTPSQWDDAADEARRVREAVVMEKERVEAKRRASLTPAESQVEIATMWRDLKRSQLVEAENKPHLRESVSRKKKDLKDAEAKLREAELNVELEARHVKFTAAVEAESDVKLAATLVESGVLGNPPGSEARFAYLLLQQKLANAASIDAARDIAEEIMQHERTATMERLAGKRKAEAEAIIRDEPISVIENLRADRAAAEEQALKLSEVAPANVAKPGSYITRPDPIDGALQAAKQDLFNNHGQST